MLRTLAFSTASLLLLWCAGRRAAAYRDARRPETGYLAIALLAMGLAIALNIAPILLWLDQSVWRVANLSILISHLLAVCTAWAAIEMVSGVAARSRRNRQAQSALFTACGLAMAVTFLSAHPAPEAPLFFERYAQDGQLLGYWNLFGITLTAAIGYVAFAAWRDSRAQRGVLRHSLSLIAIGAMLECAFMASRLTAIWATLPSGSGSFALGAMAAGACTLAFGALVPGLATAQRRRRERRRLLRIWEATTGTYPHVREARRPHSTYRAVIEIQDALAEARAGCGPTTALMQRLEAMPPRPAEQMDTLVDDILKAAGAPDRLGPR